MQYSKTIRGPRPSEQSILTILFTDIERSVANTQRLGDVGAHALVRVHNTIVRQALREHSGGEVKHTGDGIMATFGSAARAVSCAVAIMDAAQWHNERAPEPGFRLRIGLNAGEPVAEDADLFGTAVQLASRACDKADAGQIIATDVVRQLVAGRGFRFRDCGEAMLKGFAEPTQLWEVTADTRPAIDLPIELPRWFRRFGRARVLAAAAPLLLVGIAGAATGAWLMRDSGGAEAERVSGGYTVTTTQDAVRSFIEYSHGDCVSSDIVLAGRSESVAVSGDAGFVGKTTWEAVFPRSSQCREMQINSQASFDAGGGDVFFAETAGLSTDVGEPAAGIPIGAGVRSVTSSALVIRSGTGKYAGVTGRGLCDATTIQDEDGGLTQTACTLKLRSATESLPVEAQAVSSSSVISVELSASEVPHAANVAVIYRNNTKATLTGVSLRLATPIKARISTGTEGEPAATVDGEQVWQLPALAPGETAHFRFSIRLLESAEDTLTLVPEIHANGLDEPATSDPITLAVVR